jgi:hypothetical protein
MDRENIKKLYKYIKKFKDNITNEAYTEICHYFEHGEYEMAFEGLIIELILKNNDFRDFEKLELRTLGVQFELNKNSVFDFDIWNKFIIWLDE